jgi:glycerate kinase
MTAAQACETIAEGLRFADPSATVETVPLADGGEGTARTITTNAGGRFETVRVTGPLGDPVTAEFGLIDGGRVAVLDMASASGIELLDRSRLNPLRATSYGTGELIRGALDAGARQLIIGIGGSATVDGGIGMLLALGFQFFDVNGNPAGQGGQALEKIDRIDGTNKDSRLDKVSIRVACDVTNPLLGERGAAAVFGPQKGATPEMVVQLERGLGRLAEAWKKVGLTDRVDQSGDGAAGGMGAALRVCLGASVESGALLVMRYSGFYEKLPATDLVITGEGMTDGQTAGGKLCSVVARECRSSGVPVALLSGALSGDPWSLLGSFDYAVSIARGQIGLDAMIRDSRGDLRFAAANLARALVLGKRIAGGQQPGRPTGSDDPR